MTQAPALYHKRGRVSRLEDGVLLDIRERGIAWEEGHTFRCEPEEGAHLAPLSAERVLAAADAIRSVAQGRVSVERLIVSEGRAEHEYCGRRWSDVTERIHVALTRGRLRAVLDLGSFDVSEVRAAVDALSRAEAERPAPPALRLAPAVAAALLPVLPGGACEGIELVQSAGGVDGMGAPVEEARGGERGWPNWFRPSYRTRPVRMPFNLAARAASPDIDPGLPLAVTLLEPPRGTSLRVLVDDGGRVFPAMVTVDAIRAVAHEKTWYPFGAGSFGAEMML